MFKGFEVKDIPQKAGSFCSFSDFSSCNAKSQMWQRVPHSIEIYLSTVEYISVLLEQILT